MSLYAILITSLSFVPLSLSYDRRLRFYTTWKYLLPAILLSAAISFVFENDRSDPDEIVDSIIADFSEGINQDIQPQIVSCTVYTPYDWRDQFNLHCGSRPGLSHNMNQIGYFRPYNKDEQYKNVFYVDASTARGAGIPMAMISSKLAGERVQNFFNTG